VSTREERILIHRLAAGELDALDGERAHSLVERVPDLARLLRHLEELEARVQLAFPEPPPLGDRREFAELMDRLSGGGVEPAAPPLPVRGRDLRGMRAAQSPLREAEIIQLRDVPVFAARRVASSDYVSSAPGAPWPGDRSPGAHLFHLREIRREDGLPVELELYAGDVLALHSEVLIVSAFPGSYHPTPGSAFGAIRERYGLSFGSEPPPGAVRHPDGLLHFRGIACPAFDSLWVIELREPGQPFTVKDLRRALRAVEARLPDMLETASSITLPLLGTGDQGLDPRDVARELLSAFPGWARNPRLRTIRVFALALEHVAVLNRALDDRDYGVVDRPFEQACMALRRSLERRDWSGSEPLRLALKDLLQIATAPDASRQSIALEGRRIAEIALRALSQERARAAQPSLFETMDEDEPRPVGRRGRRAAPNLQLLLAHGRAAAAGESIGSHDAVMVVHAAIGVAETVREVEEEEA
jgi:hypothetical protein